MSEYVLSVTDGIVVGAYLYYYDKSEMPDEVVRCRDCKHWEDLTMYADVGVCTKPCGDPNVDEGAWAKPDGFCAWGERKGDR